MSTETPSPFFLLTGSNESEVLAMARVLGTIMEALDPLSVQLQLKVLRAAVVLTEVEGGTDDGDSVGPTAG